MAPNECQQKEAEARWSNYYLAVVREGKQVMYEVTIALYAGGNMRPDEYLKKSLNYTDNDCREIFLHEQQELLSSWPKGVPYDIGKAASDPKWDITLHYRLQQRACNLAPHVTWHAAKWNSLERLLFRLKEVRNDVSHHIRKLSQTDLEKRILELEGLYSQILRAVGQIKNKSFEKKVKRMFKKLSYRASPYIKLIKENPINGVKDEKFDSELNFLDKVKFELLKKYDHKRELNPGGIKLHKPVNISSLYSMPKLTISENESRITHRKIKADKLLKLIEVENSETNVVVVGPTGSGKTALMLYILDQWCSKASGVAGIDAVDLLFYVDLASLRATSLLCLIKDNLLTESFSHIKSSQVIHKLQQWRTVWLLDGFDQCSSRGQKVVKDICNKFSSVFITVRPEFVSLLKSHTKKETIISELDVTDVTSAKDISKRICLHVCGKKASEPLVDKFMKFMAGIGGMHRGLINSPLQVTRLCILWLDSHTKHETIETCMQLYMGLLSVTLNKFVQHLVKKTDEIRIILEQKMLNLIDTLSKIAWEMLTYKAVVLTEIQVNLLHRKCKELGLFDYHLMILSLFLDTSDCQDRYNTYNQKPTYKFREKKDMEYFAARHMHTLLKTDEKFCLYQVIENDKRWLEVVVNFVGIIALENALSPALAKQIVDYMKKMEYRLMDWIHVLNESMGNAHLVEEMSFIFDTSRYLILDGNRLMDNWKTVLALVSHWRVLRVQLYFDSKPENVKDTLKRVEILMHRSRNIAVLCNWSLHEYSCNDTVDDFLILVSAIPCCHLTEFTGHVSSFAIVKFLPKTVEKLALRLRTQEQANALQSWLKKYPVADLDLIIDFSISLLPNFLPRLTPMWLVKNTEIPHFSHFKVTVPRYDIGRQHWVEEVLRRLYKGRYASVLLGVRQLTSTEETTDEADSEGLKFRSLAELDEDGVCRVLKAEAHLVDREFSYVMKVWVFLEILCRLFSFYEIILDNAHFCLLWVVLYLLLAHLFHKTKKECDKAAQEFPGEIHKHGNDTFIIKEVSR